MKETEIPEDDGYWVEPEYENQLATICEDAYKHAVHKGFWAASDNILEKLFLVLTEYYEAVDALEKKNYGLYKKDTFDDEIADVIIRLADIVGYYSAECDEVGWYDWYVIRSEFQTVRQDTAMLLEVAKDVPSWICQIGEEYRGIGELQEVTVRKIMGTIIHLLNVYPDTLQQVEWKMHYNKSRPHLHGKTR